MPDQHGATNLYDALIIAIPGILAFLSSIIMGVINRSKTKEVQASLNDEFEKFKAESTAQYQKTLDDAIILAKIAEEKEKQVVIEALENRVKVLQDELGKVK